MYVVLVADLQLFGDGQPAYCGAWVVRQPERTNVLCVVGHRLKIKRTFELYGVATWMLNRLTERIFVRLLRSGNRGAEDVGVERPTCMNMCLPEINVPLGVALGEAQRGGEDANAGSEHGCCQATADGRSQCHNIAPAFELIAQPFNIPGMLAAIKN